MKTATPPIRLTPSQYASAAKFRDVIKKIAIGVIDEVRPPYRYGEVMSVDPISNTCEVRYEGESSYQEIPTSTSRPSVGQVVRVAGMSGDRYVDDVMSVAGSGGPGTSGGSDEWVSFGDFGGMGLPGFDNTPAMNLAVDHAIAIGAAGICPPLSLFPFEIAGRTDLKTVDFHGFGQITTTFVTTTAGAGIDITAIGSVGGGVYGGESGHFQVDGNGIALAPLVVGRRVSSLFSNIRVFNLEMGIATDSVGLTLSTTQNCQFNDVVVVGGRVCCRFDLGAFNNAFYKGEIAGSSYAHIEFRATGTSPVGHFQYTGYNSFTDTVIEGTTADTKYMIRSLAGALNCFRHCPISVNGSIIGGYLPTDMDYAVWCDTDESIQSSLIMDDIMFTGGNSAAVAYGANIGTAARIQVRGGSIGACDWPGQGNILIESEPWIFGSVTAGWLSGAGTLADPRTEHRVPSVWRTNGTGVDIINARVITDTAERYLMNTDGTFGYGNGTDPVDIVGGRLVAGVYGLSIGHWKTGDWNQSHTVSNAGDHMWINGGVLRMKASAPSSGTDGAIVGGQSMVALTQDDYDALGATDPNTLYLITL